ARRERRCEHRRGPDGRRGHIVRPVGGAAGCFVGESARAPRTFEGAVRSSNTRRRGPRRAPARAWGLALVSATLALAPALGAAQSEQAPAGAPVLRPPELIEAPELALPEGAEPLPDDASVLLLLSIDRDGAVSDARVLEPLREDVDALALEAARAMRFSPATRDGEPVPARIQFRFRVAAPAPPPEQGEP